MTFFNNEDLKKNSEVGLYSFEGVNKPNFELCFGLTYSISQIIVALLNQQMRHLKCLYDQILDIHFFTFSYTIGLS